MPQLTPMGQKLLFAFKMLVLLAVCVLLLFGIAVNGSKFISAAKQYEYQTQINTARLDKIEVVVFATPSPTATPTAYLRPVFNKVPMKAGK